MKVSPITSLLGCVLLFAVALGQGEAPAAAGPAAAKPAIPPPVRDLPADTLRDFPGVCFGSTTFRFYQVGENWPLTPFCGLATCLTDGRHLIERVRDCGLMPKENPKCKISNPQSRNETFPACCPKFTCEEGIELEYPTPEELQAFAQQAHQAQLAAAAAAQQAQAVVAAQVAAGGQLRPQARPQAARIARAIFG